MRRMRVHIENIGENPPCPSCGENTTLYLLEIMKENGLGKSFILCRNCICEISYRLNEICGVEFPFIEKEGGEK